MQRQNSSHLTSTCFCGLEFIPPTIVIQYWLYIYVSPVLQFWLDYSICFPWLIGPILLFCALNGRQAEIVFVLRIFWHCVTFYECGLRWSTEMWHFRRPLSHCYGVYWLQLKITIPSLVTRKEKWRKSTRRWQLHLLPQVGMCTTCDLIVMPHELSANVSMTS